jgi:hypothetical protein
MEQEKAPSYFLATCIAEVNNFPAIASGNMDHVDKAKVRSTVGLMVDAGWFMDAVNAIGGCSDGDHDCCTYPT